MAQLQFFLHDEADADLAEIEDYLTAEAGARVRVETSAKNRCSATNYFPRNRRAYRPTPMLSLAQGVTTLLGSVPACATTRVLRGSGVPL